MKPVSTTDLANRRSTRLFGLALDVVRAIAPGGLGAMVALATAESPSRGAEIMQHPPKLGDVPARTLTRTWRIGVLGEIRVGGGRIPDLNLAMSASGAGLDLGQSSRGRR